VSVAVAPRTLIDSDNGVRQKGLSIQHQKRLLMAYFAINMMRLTIGLSERCQLIAVSMRGMICTCRLAIHPAINRANRNGIGVKKGALVFFQFTITCPTVGAQPKHAARRLLRQTDVRQL